MNTFVDEEIRSQPECWRQAGELLPEVADLLPRPGERVAVVGCGTSWFMAMAYACLREGADEGETDAFAGCETPFWRRYDRVVAITRSGTTSEILHLLEKYRDAGIPTVTLTGAPDAPVKDLSDAVVDLSFADEQSVVQTRFATTALTLLRAHLGADVEELAQDAERALAVPVEPYAGAEQISFLGLGWTVGLAHEAALKTREAAQFWAEAYPAMDYRHGPIAIAEPGRLVWSFGEPPRGLDDDVAETGATLVTSDLDPVAHLVVAQRLAVALSKARGLDPDRPRHLSRAVELPAGTLG